MSEYIFKEVNYSYPFVELPKEFEGVLKLRFTDSDYKTYSSSLLICGYPELHVIKKFRKGLYLCLVPVLSSDLNCKSNLYHICYFQA